ncbi:MAG: protein translocase subunit SecD, partial [Kiloniellales bacterium]
MVVILTGLILAAPNLLQRETAEGLPGWVPSNQINLGLDLQGGSYLLLEADIDSVIREQVENLVDGTRAGLRRAKIGYTGLGVSGEAVVFTLRDTTLRNEVREIVGGFGNDLLISSNDEGEFEIRFTDQSLAERRNSVIEQSIEVVRRRIDETGT